MVVHTQLSYATLGVYGMVLFSIHMVRILLFLVSMPFHAFIGTMLMGSKTLLSEAWYLPLDRTWGLSPRSGQYLAGGILWATGDFTMLGVMSALFLGSYRQSHREERAWARQGAAAAGPVYGDDSPQGVGVSGAMMQPLPPDTRTDE